jgi:flagellar biosynthesis anti-sigma factor FlgM
MKIQDQQARAATELGVGGARAPRTEEKRPDQPAAGTSATSGSAGPAATVSLSSRSRELHGALAAAKAAPDIRQDKVADVRRRLDNGTYVIDPTRIARGILDSRA